MTPDVQTMRTARSDDGTTIGFECAGEGPPLILIGGALSSGDRDFPPSVELARLLEPRFTVYRFDRRGRGDSDDTPPYAVEREVRDIKALISDANGAVAATKVDGLPAHAGSSRRPERLGSYASRLARARS